MPFWGVCTSLPPSSRSLYISATAASLGLYLFFRSFRQSLNHAGPDVIPSPGESVLPFLANTVLQQLAYPPDALPGARDVDSPYGSIRVYEWGPKDGRKVLLIHGISTPSVALGPLAHKLVEKGCRVMLFGASTSLCISSFPLPSFNLSSFTLSTIFPISIFFFL